MHQHYADKLQEQLEESSLFTPFLGINVTIYDDKLGIWDASCGYANPQTKEKLKQRGLFYIYSITKTFTAALILKLVEEGKFSLDHFGYNLLPDLKIEQSITLRQLLNHTAGLPNYTELEDYQPSVTADPDKPWKEERIVDLIKTGKLDFEPGSGWHYSNTGYFVLKKIIEHCTKLSFTDAIKKYISGPLELSNTFAAEYILSDQLVAGYGRELQAEKRMEDIRHKYHPGWCYTGMLVSSTNETAKFYHELFTSNLLSKTSTDEIIQSVSIAQGHPLFKEPCYGLGVMIDTRSKYGLLIGHGGSGPGYNPWVMHLPDFFGRALTIAVFANAGFGIIPMFLVNDLLAQIAGTD